MKPLVLALALALSSCAWDDYIAAYPTSTIASRPDPAAAALIQCDRLGFTKGSDGHHLCILREIDRLQVRQGTGYAPIQILPHAFPSLVPPGTITVVPAK